MERNLNQPIVIDQGSGTLKAGFAGSDHPTTYFPSYVGELRRVRNAPMLLRDQLMPCCSRRVAGRPKHTKVMAGAVEGDTFVGKKAQELRGLLRIK